MAVTLSNPLHNYVRTSAPAQGQSLTLWLDAELKKIERSITAINEALKQIAAVA
ncbi:MULTISPECIES: hypothetical protein [Burkholderia]|uniref:hypothetical protein n=1 Tax=Burkholderia TaxID=32008 RepID=UPI0026520622|nr:hypothetical protein [Burkholderia vietnamiensis]MDN8037458.1 hypothetical protein [Burkholderia vietnamiensis]